MNHNLHTPTEAIKQGTKIRIIRMNDTTTPSPSFPDGIDHQARAYNGKTGTVTFIDSVGQIHGTWGGLALIPGMDKFEIIEEI